MIEKGKHYIVKQDSLHNFIPGDIVVALEDDNSIGFFTRLNDYVEGKKPEDYDTDKYDVLEINEVEEI